MGSIQAEKWSPDSFSVSFQVFFSCSLHFAHSRRSERLGIAPNDPPQNPGHYRGDHHPMRFVKHYRGDRHPMRFVSLL